MRDSGTIRRATPRGVTAEVAVLPGSASASGLLRPSP